MKIVLAAVAGMVINMIWGFMTWGLLADQFEVVKPLPGEAELRPALQAAATESGVYFLPVEDFQSEAWAQRHVEGPIAFLYLHPTGFASNMGKQLSLGAGHYFLSTLLIVMILRLAGPPTAFGARVGVVTLIGLFAGFLIYGATHIWWYAPASYTLYAIAMTTIGWLLAGLAVAGLIKR